MSAQQRSQPEDRFMRDVPIHQQRENREGKALGLPRPTHRPGQRVIKPGAFGERTPSHLVEALVPLVQKMM